jgi:hypothetical protein
MPESPSRDRATAGPHRRGGVAAVEGVLDTLPEHLPGDFDDEVVDEHIAEEVGRKGGRVLLQVSVVELVRDLVEGEDSCHIGEHALAQGLDMGGIDGLVKDRETLLAHGARSFHDMCSLQLAAVPLPRTDFDLGQYVILARWRLDCRSSPHRDTSMLL